MMLRAEQTRLAATVLAQSAKIKTLEARRAPAPAHSPHGGGAGGGKSGRAKDKSAERKATRAASKAAKRQQYTQCNSVYSSIVLYVPTRFHFSGFGAQ